MNGPVCYHLGSFPPANIEWARLVPLIGAANAALARYDGLVAAIPNASILLSPLTTEEAVLSSKIEGTNVIILHLTSSRLSDIRLIYTRFHETQTL